MFRLQFTDPYMTDKLFNKAVVVENIPPLTFTFPPSAEKLPSFMASVEGKIFSDNVVKIIDQLTDWSLQHNIFPRDVGIILDRIKGRFTSESVNRISNLKDRFSLCTTGVNNFHAINVMLARDHHSLKYKINQITILISNLNAACDDGVVTYTYNARSMLSSHPMIGLIAVKRFLAEEVATQSLGQYQFLQEVNGYGYKDGSGDYVIEGNHVHYVNALINFYNEQIGIEQVYDDRANIRIENLEYKLKNFVNFVNDHFTGRMFIHQLAKQFDLSDIEKKLADDYKATEAAFTSRLDVLGNDELFSLQAMLDQEAIADDRYVFTSTASTLLRVTLVERLMNNDYFKRVGHTVAIPDGEMILYPDMPENTVVIRKVAGSESAERIALLSLLTENGKQHSAIWQVVLADAVISKYLYNKLGEDVVLIMAAKSGALPSDRMKQLVVSCLSASSVGGVNAFIASHLRDILKVKHAPKLTEIVSSLSQPNRERFLESDAFAHRIVKVLNEQYKSEKVFDKFLVYLEANVSVNSRVLCYSRFIDAWAKDFEVIPATFNQVMRFFSIVTTNSFIEVFFSNPLVQKHFGEAMKGNILVVLEKLSVEQGVRLIEHFGITSNIFLDLIKSDKGLSLLFQLQPELIYDLVAKDLSLVPVVVGSSFVRTEMGINLCRMIKCGEDKRMLEKIVKENDKVTHLLGFKPSTISQIICSKDKNLLDVIGSIVFSPRVVVALVHYVCHHLPGLANIDLSKLKYEKYTEAAMYVYYAAHELANSISSSVAVNGGKNRFFTAVDNVNAVQAAIKLFLSSSGMVVELTLKERFQANSGSLAVIQQMMAVKLFRNGIKL